MTKEAARVDGRDEELEAEEDEGTVGMETESDGTIGTDIDGSM